MIVPYESIAPETLDSLIESVVLRDGTDYGEVELSLEQKVALVKQQLADGVAVIEYSQVDDSITIKSI